MKHEIKAITETLKYWGKVYKRFYAPGIEYAAGLHSGKVSCDYAPYNGANTSAHFSIEYSGPLKGEAVNDFVFIRQLILDNRINPLKRVKRILEAI